MNILNLLTKEERVAGVEISDRVIRIAYFRPKKRFSKKKHEDSTELVEHELILIEEPITANIIKEGSIINKELFSKTLKDIWTRAKLKTNYAIVAIPEDKIYSHVFTFPKSVNEVQLKDAISLAINFQLPVKKSDVYIGYQNVDNSHATNEVLISTISKNTSDGYTDTLNSAGIKILALESHLASISRSIKLESGQMTLFLKKNPDGVTMFILKDSFMYFSRTIPTAFIKEEGFLESEASRVKTSFEYDRKTPVVEKFLSEATIRDEYLQYPELNKLTPESQSKWLIAIGAAIRGEIKKGQDNQISLLPVGTAEAYDYQKTTTFIALIRNLAIGISIFFVFTFLGAYFFIFSLSQKASKISLNVSASTISPDMLQKEASIRDINALTAASAVILSTTPDWSMLLDDINSRVISGILISNFSVASINDLMSMTGTAKDRDTLNQFKKSLQASTYLTGVELPITNLEQKGDIPFSLSFRLKDPSMLYYK